MDFLLSQLTTSLSMLFIMFNPSVQIQKLLEEFITDSDILKDVYLSLTRAVNELRVQHSTNNTLFVCDENGVTSNTFIAEVLAKKVTFNINDPELRQWSHVNQFA
jgi:hypothetical protein